MAAQEGHLLFLQQFHVSLYHCNRSSGSTPPSYHMSPRHATTGSLPRGIEGSGTPRTPRYPICSSVLSQSGTKFRRAHMYEYLIKACSRESVLQSILAHGETWMGLFGGRTKVLTQSCVEAEKLHNLNKHG